MRFDGVRWTRSQNSVALPADWTAPADWPAGGPDNVYFARVLRPGRPVPAGAVKTDRRHRTASGDEPVYARPVRPDGWSQRNKMYGADGYVYLLYDGRVYVRRAKAGA